MKVDGHKLSSRPNLKDSLTAIASEDRNDVTVAGLAPSRQGSRSANPQSGDQRLSGEASAELASTAPTNGLSKKRHLRPTLEKLPPLKRSCVVSALPISYDSLSPEWRKVVRKQELDFIWLQVSGYRMRQVDLPRWETVIFLSFFFSFFFFFCPRRTVFVGD